MQEICTANPCHLYVNAFLQQIIQKEVWLMPARLIIYPLFFILKDFLIAYLLAKTETPKKPEIGFFPIGVIASVSELAGFWFIQMFAGEATVRRFWHNFPVGFMRSLFRLPAWRLPVRRML